MEKNDFVRISYTGRIKETGEVFDTTDEEIAKKEKIFNPKAKYGAVPIIVGEEKTIKGIDEALLEMKVGEKKTIDVPPEKGFGKRNPNLIKLIPLSEFKKQNISPFPGMPITMDNIRGRVLSVNSGRVRVDFNNPLAGKNLAYELEIKEKIDNEEEKAKAICEYYKYECSKVLTDKNKSQIELMLKEDASRKIKETIAKDIMNYLGYKKVKFSDIFEENVSKEKTTSE